MLEPKYCPYCKYPLETIQGRKYCPDCKAFYYIQVEVAKVDSPLLSLYENEDVICISSELAEELGCYEDLKSTPPKPKTSTRPPLF